jgi:uncharacterized integral membrane protein
MPQRLFYRPSKKWPRMLWGATLGILVALVFVRVAMETTAPQTGAPNVRWMLPVILAIPGGALGGYLFALFDPLRARGLSFVANICGGLLYIFVVGVAFTLGMNGPR